MQCNFVPYEGDQPYLFVSYSHKDDDRVAPILNRLAAEGFRIWYDEGIEWGSEWPEEIERHLLNCHACLAFHSATSVDSANCRQEITYAIQNKKEMLPVYLENIKLKFGLEMQMTLYQAIHRWQYAKEEPFFKRLMQASVIHTCRDGDAFPLEEVCPELTVFAGPKPTPYSYFDDAVTGTTKARQILEPLYELNRMVNSGRFDFLGDLQIHPDAVTWETIREGRFDTVQFHEQCERIVRQRTDMAKMNQIRQWIRSRFQAYRKKVQEFVDQEGERAFVNLYWGYFAPVDHQYGIGIHKMLVHLAEGKLADGRTVHFPSPEECHHQHRDLIHTIIDTRLWVLDIHGIRRTQREQWLRSKSMIYQAEINANRRAVVLGAFGYLSREFLEPSVQLAEEIEAKCIEKKELFSWDKAGF